MINEMQKMNFAKYMKCAIFAHCIRTVLRSKAFFKLLITMYIIWILWFVKI